MIWIDSNPQAGREMRGRHPPVVLAPREFNERTGIVIGLPMTTAAYHGTNPFAVKLKGTPGRNELRPWPSAEVVRLAGSQGETVPVEEGAGGVVCARPMIDLGSIAGLPTRLSMGAPAGAGASLLGRLNHAGYGKPDCNTASRFGPQFFDASPYTSVIRTNVTDAMLCEGWTAPQTHRGERDAVFDCVNEIVDEATSLPDQERQRQRRIALAMLQEVGAR